MIEQAKSFNQGIQSMDKQVKLISIRIMNEVEPLISALKSGNVSLHQERDKNKVKVA